MILNYVWLNYSLDYIYIYIIVYKKMNVKSKDDIIV